MAYTKTTWTDRVVQYANRYKDQNNVVYTFTRDSGNVIEAGTPVTANYLNHLEQGVYDAHYAIDNIDLTPYATKESPTFTGTVTLPVTNNYSTPTSTNEKVGHDTMSGTSKTVTDSFITANTFVTIIPLSNPAGSMVVNSNAGNFVVTSTKSETLTFKWIAVK